MVKRTTPFVTSMTRIIVSMICAPPMMVRMRDAWPGQSTRVNCRDSCPNCCSCAGAGTYTVDTAAAAVAARGAGEGRAVWCMLSDVLPRQTQQRCVLHTQRCSQ